MKKSYSIILIAILFLGIFLIIQSVPNASADLDGSLPQLSMPVEYISYNISDVNGSFCARIDGTYPISIVDRQSSTYDLPMLYPMPPGTTNIHVWLNNQEIVWSNYTAIYPAAVHATGIGDWWMIQSMLANVTGHFLLKIHYEHPIESVDGKYRFLYDLNISPYLSAQYSNSTAYFTIYIDRNISGINVYTAQPDEAVTEWKTKEYSASDYDSSTKALSVTLYSEYDKPLAGDLVVEFSGSSSNIEYVILIPIGLVSIILGFVIVWLVKKKIHR